MKYCSVFFCIILAYFSVFLESSQARIQSPQTIWQKQYVQLINMLQESRIKYQKGKIIDSHLMVMKAYFDIFENMEIPLRHQFGNIIVFTIEGYFADLREITSQDHFTSHGAECFLRIVNSIKKILQPKIILLDSNKVPI